MSRANQEKVSATNSSELNKIHSIIKNSSFKILETCIKTGNEFLKQAKKCDLDRLGLAPGLAKIETDTKALSELNNFFKKIEKVFKLNDDFKIMLELGKMTATDKSVMAKVKKVKMMYETTGEELNLMIDNVPADKKTQECLQMLIERNKNVSNCLDNVHETVLKICQELGKENVSSKALEESKNEATVNDVTDTIEKIQQSFCGGEKQNVLEKTPEVTQHSFLEMTNSTHNAQNTQNDIELENSGVNSSEPSPKAFVDIKNQETKRNEEVKEKDLSSSTNRVGGKIIEVGNSGVNLGEFSTKAIAVVKNQQTKRNEEVEVEIVPPSTNRIHGKIIELRAKPATFDIPGNKSMENLNYNQINPTLSSTLIDDDNERCKYLNDELNY
ncbi:CLUMA_CG004231, isoform A [Clunio marinus]|uniref:CLUMA_CG004231, isoform A n=1 Tax=Clunio marinus TaxID=568069 RepID=A0A1J1HQY4_9DIPT|nr:CLUMA_CG004231, isoform A [Clunio marinus]